MITPNEVAQLKNSMNSLGQELMQQAQDAHGFFVTKTTYAVGYSDPDLRNKVQEKLDHSVAILGIANLMAIFEAYFPKKYWTKILKNSNATQRLRAYRHIRFSAINGFTEIRSKENYKDFDKIMSRNDPLLGVKNYTNEKLCLSISAVNSCYVFIQEQWNKAIVEVHNL